MRWLLKARAAKCHAPLGLGHLTDEAEMRERKRPPARRSRRRDFRSGPVIARLMVRPAGADPV
jgi:hypothetical protein